MIKSQPLLFRAVVRAATAVLLIRAALDCGEAWAIVDQDTIRPQAVALTVIGNANQTDQAQTFTVGRNGMMTGIDVWMLRVPITSKPLLYDIRRTNASGAPIESNSGSGVLVKGMIDPTFVPLNTSTAGGQRVLTHIDFTDSAFAVTKGELLAVAFQTDDPGEMNGLAYSWALNQNIYTRGSLFRRSALSNFVWGPRIDFDAMFRTYVTPIPEPNSLAILILAYAALLPRLRW